MLEENYRLVPLLFMGYIDPSAGHVFSSMGPIIFSAIGGAFGVGVMILVKARDRIRSVFKKGGGSKLSSPSDSGQATFMSTECSKPE